MPDVSFKRDIRPLFRAVDISHMEVHGIELDDYTFMSDPENANKVLEALSPHDDQPPAMPPGGPTVASAPLTAIYRSRLVVATLSLRPATG